MDSTILDIIKSFKSNSRVKKFKFKDFLVYVHQTFETKIKISKLQKLKDKYKKMRLSVLNYILANEKEITAKILNHK
jgi:hypothetical protein